MSRRGGHVFIAGASYPCRLCGGPIPPGEPILCVPFAPMPKWEPMTNFEGMICHVHCWHDWPEHDRFVEQFNEYSHDARIYGDGSVDWLLLDGSVEEHENRVHVISKPVGTQDG